MSNLKKKRIGWNIFDCVEILLALLWYSRDKLQKVSSIQFGVAGPGYPAQTSSCLVLNSLLWFYQTPIHLGSRRWNWNSRKKHFLIRIPNFCFIQVILFDLGYIPVAAIGTEQVRYHDKNVKNIKKSFSHFFMVAYLLSPNSCH